MTQGQRKKSSSSSLRRNLLKKVVSDKPARFSIVACEHKFLCATHIQRMSQKIVSTGPGLDLVEGVTRRFFGCYCRTEGSSTGSSHACIRQPQEPPERTLLAQPRRAPDKSFSASATAPDVFGDSGALSLRRFALHSPVDVSYIPD